MQKNYFIFYLLMIPVVIIGGLISLISFIATAFYSYIKKDKEDEVC